MAVFLFVRCPICQGLLYTEDDDKHPSLPLEYHCLQSGHTFYEIDNKLIEITEYAKGIEVSECMRN